MKNCFILHFLSSLNYFDVSTNHVVQVVGVITLILGTYVNLIESGGSAGASYTQQRGERTGAGCPETAF